MSNSPTDPFEILADEITRIRRQIDHLQRTSLNRQEGDGVAVARNGAGRGGTAGSSPPRGRATARTGA